MIEKLVKRADFYIYMLHAAVIHDFCSAGGCHLRKEQRENNWKVKSENKNENLIGKVEENRCFFAPSILRSIDSLDVSGSTESPLA